MDKLHLSCGALSVGIAPAMGGALTYFRSTIANDSSVDWMRPWTDRGRGPLDSTSFVMVPFFSWLEKDDFMFGDRHVQLQPSGLGFDRSLLGLGWTTAWNVDRLTQQTATLSHRNFDGAWPWRYHVQQIISLSPERLIISVNLRNEDTSPMPAGIGLHTFFPRSPGSRVKANVKAMHLMSEQGLPYAVAPDHPAVQMLAAGSELQTGLDNVFEGWDGSSVISGAHGKLRISAQTPYQFLCVNAPHDADYFCVEPVTHTTNALHRPILPDGKTGFTVLAPGDSMTASAIYQPELNLW
jgi:aldose 1-epimerase